MFRLWKGRKDAENKTNNLNEKNTHEIKSQIENDGTNGTDLDKPGSHLIDPSPHFQDLLSWRRRGPCQ